MCDIILYHTIIFFFVLTSTPVGVILVFYFCFLSEMPALIMTGGRSAFRESR